MKRTATKQKELATPEHPALPEELDHAEFRELWPEWLAHKDAMGQGMSVRAAKMALRRISNWGLKAACAAVIHSIAKEWEGIYPDPAFTGGGPSGPVKPESVFSMKTRLESKQRVAMQLYSQYSLEYPEGQKRHPDAYKEYRQLKEECRAIERQLAKL